MPKHIILKFPLSSHFLGPFLEVSARWEEQIWCLNIKSIELKWPVSFICEMSSGCMDLCTFFSIWDMHRALANCWHPSIFSTLVIFALQSSFMSWSLVSKLKLNTWVLKYSISTLSTQVPPGGTQILEYSMVLSKVLIFLAVKALDHPNSLACHTLPPQ